MSVQEHCVFTISDWSVDSLALSLTNGSTTYPLPAKVMAVLVYLARNHDRLVTRQELIDAIWDGNVYVGEKALNNAIWRIRQTLGRDADDAEFVKTTPKTGYQLLVAPTFVKPEESNGSGRVSAAPKYVFALIAVLVVLTMIVFITQRSPTHFVDETLVVVTQLPGRELYAAPSPDGTSFAFMHVSQQGSQDIYVQSLQESKAQPVLLSERGTSNFAPSWAPDSTHLAYIRIDDRRGACEIVVRDMQSETDDVIDECIDVNQRTLSWSPDGRWLVYRKPDPEFGPGLYLRAIDPSFATRGEINDRRISCTDCTLIDQEVSWSPDSRMLAVTRTRNRLSEEVYRFTLDEWTFRRLTFGESSIEGHTWDRHGDNLLFVSDKHSLNRRLWAINLRTKEKREIGYEGAGFPVYLPNYESILFYQRQARSYIAAIKIDGDDITSTFPSVVVQTSGSDRNPSYSPESGKLAYYSNISGHNEIWVANTDGTNRRQLTQTLTAAIDPSWSPDGQKIAFLSIDTDSESMQINIYNVRTKSFESIDSVRGNLGSPTWSRDGLSLVVPIWRGAAVDLWRVTIDGNQVTRVTVGGGEFGRESTDGKYLYYEKPGEAGLFRAPASGGPGTLIVDDLRRGGFGNWAITGPSTLVYSRVVGDHSQIVRFDLMTSDKKVLVRHPGRIVHSTGMLSYSEQAGLLFFTHMEPQQIDILMAPDPLAENQR